MVTKPARQWSPIRLPGQKTDIPVEGEQIYNTGTPLPPGEIHLAVNVAPLFRLFPELFSMNFFKFGCHNLLTYFFLLSEGLQTAKLIKIACP